MSKLYGKVMEKSTHYIIFLVTITKWLSFLTVLLCFIEVEKKDNMFFNINQGNVI